MTEWTGLAGVRLTVTDEGSGRPVVVLHGGGGPQSVATIVEHYAAGSRVIAPTLPGWNGTSRPGWLDTVDDIGYAIVDLLRRENLDDVSLIGSSVGGWLACVVAGLDADRGRVRRVCLVDSMGICVPGQPIRDFFALNPREVADYSFHDGDRFYIDPATMSDEARATQAANMVALQVFAGDPYMHDPQLPPRLDRITVPVLGVWGADDRIATPDYGRALLGHFADSRFEVVEGAGHLPHIERPEATFELIDAFLDG